MAVLVKVLSLAALVALAGALEDSCHAGAECSTKEIPNDAAELLQLGSSKHLGVNKDLGNGYVRLGSSDNYVAKLDVRSVVEGPWHVPTHSDAQCASRCDNFPGCTNYDWCPVNSHCYLFSGIVSSTTGLVYQGSSMQCRTMYKNQACPPIFPHSSHGGKICYTEKVYADRGVGPCESWCTNVPSYGSGCGDPSKKMCQQAPSYRYIANKCVSGSNIVKHTGKSLTECKSLCNAEPTCKAIEYAAKHIPGNYAYMDCQLNNNDTPVNCFSSDLHLYVKDDGNDNDSDNDDNDNDNDN